MSVRLWWLGLPLVVVAVCVAMLGAPGSAAHASPPLEPALPLDQTMTTAALARVVVTPIKDRYPIGDVVTATVHLDNVEDFFGGELRWNFDPVAFQVVDADLVRGLVQVTPGDLFPPGSAIAQPRDGQANNGTGKIIFGGARLNNPPFTGSGTLVTVTFRVTGQCGDDVRLIATSETVSLSDQTANPLSFETGPGFFLRTLLSCPNRLFLPALIKQTRLKVN